MPDLLLAASAPDSADVAAPAALFAAAPARLAAERRLLDVIAAIHARGLAAGTSGNFSVALAASPLRLLITASGRDKGRLTREDLVVVDHEGRAVEPGAPKPSAETLLHVVLAQRSGVGAVLHTHSIWNTLLSDAHFTDAAIEIRGYEMLKGLAGIQTHECAVRIPIFDNTQNIAALAGRVAQHLHQAGGQAPPAFLIRGHGLYAWGRDLNEAARHVEILEFLFEVLARGAQLRAALIAARS